VSPARPERPITIDLETDLAPAMVDGDRVQQVLTNLVSNARKYSPAGGEIRIEVATSEAGVEIAVRDHGLGLPPEALQHLFEKFYRVDNSDRRQIKGTGLGLAISKKIIEAHGGRIWAESEGAGQGARFAFTLPLAGASPARGDILVVEDDPGFARLLEAALTPLGLTAVCTASAEAALERLASVDPQAVLLDLLLPGLQGEDFLRRLRALRGPDLPVTVVTVKDLSAEERAALRQMGAVATLRKGPGVASRAARAVAQALEQRARTVGAA